MAGIIGSRDLIIPANPVFLIFPDFDKLCVILLIFVLIYQFFTNFHANTRQKSIDSCPLAGGGWGWV